MTSFSIVIPTLDTWPLTLAAIRSAQEAEGPPREIIVVDDGGSSPPPTTFTEQHGVRLVRQQPTSGFSAAVNAGLRVATGEITVLLNSDAELERDALAAIARAFDADPKLGVAGATLHFPDGRPQWSGGARPTAWWLFLLASDLARRLPARAPRGHRPTRIDWVSGAAMAIRREVLLGIGLLDESFAFYAQDIDFCLRAGAATWKAELLPAVRVTHHGGATISSRSGRLSLLWSDLVLCVRRHDGDAAARRAAWAISLGAAIRLMFVWLTPRGGEPALPIRAAARAARHMAANTTKSASIPRLSELPTS